jgi:hypothetical protein
MYEVGAVPDTAKKRVERRALEYSILHKKKRNGYLNNKLI